MQRLNTNLDPFRLEVIPKDERSDTLARLAHYLLRQRIGLEMVVAIAHEWNSTERSPPLPEQEVEMIVRSIARCGGDR